MSELDVEAIRQRADAATAGPWKLWGMSVLADHAGTSDLETAIPIADTMSYPAMPPRTFNATFIAQSRADIPALCDEVDRLQDIRGRLDCTLKMLADGSGHDWADLIEDGYLQEGDLL